ncbi:MAG: Uma2 family endonuclease, partial [bacterium]
MSTVERKPATIDDLYRVEGKAELVGGEIVHMSPSGFLHGFLAGLIYRSLWAYGEKSGAGIALPDNVGFLCNLPNRNSFSPDVAFYDRTKPLSGTDFLPEPPTFAVEIRSANDYGPAAEKAMPKNGPIISQPEHWPCGMLTRMARPSSGFICTPSPKM